MFNISGVYRQQQTRGYCKLIHPISNNECPCMGRDDAARDTMNLHNVQYTRVIHSVAAD
jgi:hypothetical protein